MIDKAIILAAGEGKRMKKGHNDPYLKKTPKALLEVHGVPLIEHNIKKLHESGVDIAVVVKRENLYVFSEKLQEYDVKFYIQDEPLGTANSLYSARDFIENELFIVFMGDDITTYDVDQLLKISEPSVFGYKTTDVSSYGSIMLGENGVASEILEKKRSGEGIANTGVYILDQDFFSLYDEIESNKENGEYYLTDIVKIMYKKGKGMRLRELNHWKPVNTPEDLRSANDQQINEVKFRLAQKHDLGHLIRVIGQLSSTGYDNENMENFSTAMKQIIESEYIKMAVAEMGQEVIGTATLVLQPNISHGARPYGHIENVVVDQPHRGKSIGKGLVKYLVEIGKKENCYKIVLNCTQSNAVFYETLGFSRTGEVEMRMNLEKN